MNELPSTPSSTRRDGTSVGTPPMGTVLDPLIVVGPLTRIDQWLFRTVMPLAILSPAMVRAPSSCTVPLAAPASAPIRALAVEAGGPSGVQLVIVDHWPL